MKNPNGRIRFFKYLNHKSDIIFGFRIIKSREKLEISKNKIRDLSVLAARSLKNSKKKAKSGPKTAPGTYNFMIRFKI